MSGIDSTVAMTALKSGPVTAPSATADAGKAQQAARQFEGVFISQFVGEMFNGISTDGPFGGGQGEEMFRSLMVDEYSKQITAQGGFGLSPSIMREILKMQEKPH